MFWSKLKNWWAKHIQGVGRVVYWHNKNDSEFTGYYTITTKRDKKGYVGIHNDKVGHRVVPYYYLDEKIVKQKTNTIK